jgi:hypothetical protein
MVPIERWTITTSRTEEPFEVVRDDVYRVAVDDLCAFAQAVLDLPCAFGREGDPLATQQRRAADLINTYRLVERDHGGSDA